MAYSNNLIKEPVSIRDIQRCFGITGNNDLGTIISTAFNNNAVNLWARFKPVVFPSVDRMDNRNGIDTILKYFDYNVPLSEAIGISSGLTCNTKTAFGISTVAWNSKTISTFLSEVTQILVSDSSKMQLKMWSHKIPYGGSASPYRLSDFGIKNNANVGYYKDALLSFSYYHNEEWHSLEPYFGSMDDSEPSTKTLNLPSEDEVIEPTSQIADSWDYYEGYRGKATTSLALIDCSICIHDLLIGHSSAPSLRNMRHGIAFIDLDGNNNNYVFVGTLPFGQDNPTMNTVKSYMLSGALYAYVEFFTNAPETTTVPMSVSNTNLYTWIPIPTCCALATFQSGSGDVTTGTLIVFAAGIWDASNGRFYFDILPQVDDFNVWQEVRVVISESASGTDSSIQRTITSNDIIDDFYNYDTLWAGKTAYINLVGIKQSNGSYKIMSSYQFTYDNI